MTRKSIEEQLAQLDAKRQALKARLTTQERAKDTRRKILLGELVLNALEATQTDTKTPGAEQLLGWVKRELPGLLTRDADKVLFTELLNQKAGSKTPDLTKLNAPPKEATT